MLFGSTIMVAVTSLVAWARADYVIDPESVPLPEREIWCVQAMEACPLICEQYNSSTTLVNDCDPELLTYGCLCGNNQKPNMSEYSLTIPYFTCREWGNKCVTNCNGDATCQTSCRVDNPCGAQDPERINTTSSTTLEPTASATGSDDDVIYTDSPGSSSSENNGGGDDEGAASILAIGSSYGLIVIMASMFLGFTLI